MFIILGSHSFSNVDFEGGHIIVFRCRVLNHGLSFGELASTKRYT